MSSGVIVAGAGPAGRALVHRLVRAGVPVTLVDPNPERVWRSTFACWSDELPDWIDSAAFAARMDRIGVAGRGLEEVARGYTVFDTPGLQRSLSVDGAHVVASRVSEIDGARVHLDDGTVLTADAVVDCRGALPHDAPRQTAYGVVVDEAAAAPVLEGHQALLMDWRGGAEDRRALPSFLYVVPLGGGEYLLEETCLAGYPALGLDELQRRLENRLGGMPTDIRRVEHVAFPLTGSSPQPWRDRPFCFGAAGGFKNPTTGYSVATSLMCTDAVVAALAAGQDPTRALWPTATRAVHNLRLRGLSALLRLSPSQTVAFFEAFFAMPIPAQRAYLSDRGDLTGTMGAMTRVIKAVDMRTRTVVARGAMAKPSWAGDTAGTPL
ncbi:lycopene cyclase [Gordonia jinghuaiqii]|uniref:Lycopene cyclase n=1 Tax=Gordonia jinghuaiqii TaxID=2758710 RepID=A0A7D7RDS1_9ACTN|nr:lycopene cyclase family protein [Gordonia jinghuaiqii]MCR5976441.1 lycopene cyclase [Gordonia jinghuaiqii]QMT03650.1 lycopene cyclase [Gordonia jinghuaiqii]